MARMLGLDVSRLSVPDYEVITRLERLIQNHHASNAGLHPGVPVNTAMQDPNFRNGFMSVPVEIVDSQDNTRATSRPRLLYPAVWSEPALEALKTERVGRSLP